MDDLPTHVVEQFEKFHESLSDVENALQPLMDSNLDEASTSLDSLGKAKLFLTSMYAANSLFWMYLCTRGADADQHPIKNELERIQDYMSKVREIEDRAKAPRVNKEASKNFVRNALWDADDRQKNDKSSEEGNYKIVNREEQFDKSTERLKRLAMEIKTELEEEQNEEIERANLGNLADSTADIRKQQCSKSDKHSKTIADKLEKPSKKRRHKD